MSELKNELKFSSDERGFILEDSLEVPYKLEEVFEFFSNAENLEFLTPQKLQFSIVSPKPIKMAVGTHIDYKLKLFGIPFKWKSEIPLWEPPRRFMDVQLTGPYTYWEHEHLFEDLGDSTRIIDKVHYNQPGGALVNSLFIKPNLRSIFSFRKKQMMARFPALS